MKVLWCVLILFLSRFEKTNQKLDKNHDADKSLSSRKIHFQTALKIMQTKLNKTFVDLFPEFKKKFVKTDTKISRLKKCYDQTVEKYEKIHIFENTIYDVVQKFFVCFCNFFIFLTMCFISSTIMSFILKILTYGKH